MKELKKMIIDCLVEEYPLAEAIAQLESAEIVIKGDTVTVKYAEGVIDTYKVVVTESLILIP